MSEYFIVNKDRTVTIPPGVKVVGVENDHNCKRVMFECPRYYDGYDLTQCTQHHVNFINLTAETQGRHNIDDITIDTADESIIHFSWLISSIATAKAGEVAFSLCFNSIDTDGNIEYEWNSAYTGGLMVEQGLFVTGGDAAYSTANYPVGAILLVMEEHNYDPAEKYGGTWISYGLKRLMASAESTEGTAEEATEETTETTEDAETETAEETETEVVEEEKDMYVYVYVRTS